MILLISVFIVGLFAGVTLEYFLDVKLMHEYERENGILRGKVIQQNEELKIYKAAGNAPQVEVIDLPQADTTYHKPF